jgi:hypothetical protein
MSHMTSVTDLRVGYRINYQLSRTMTGIMLYKLELWIISVLVFFWTTMTVSKIGASSVCKIKKQSIYALIAR